MVKRATKKQGGQHTRSIKKMIVTGLEGKNVTWYPCYGAEMRGGTVNCEIVVSDTTMIHCRGKSYDWTYYIDVYNNEIISSDIQLSKHGNGINNHFNACKQFLEEKIKRGYKDLETIFHTDQGTIYSSKAFNKLYENYTIKRSMSRAGTPTDNPVIESLNGWIKNELYKDFRIYFSEDINTAINAYIKYFNTQRLAYSLKYKTPIQYRTEQGFT